MSSFRIPLLAVPQNLTTLIGSNTYQIETFYAPAANGEGGWYLNISDVYGNRLLSGIPLVTGQDLLEPFDVLDFGAILWVATPGNPGATPTETNLGTASNLYFAATS